jgi:glycosyltransferase involved in cell wall biosynthesis
MMNERFIHPSSFILQPSSFVPEGMSKLASFKRVAVIHDWLTGMRGGEEVLEAILSLFPQADIFTLFHFAGSVSPAIEAHAIHTSSLQRSARRIGNYRNLLPLFPRAIRQFNLTGYDLVISSSHCVAKGVDPKGVPHLCYCHTPMRYIWDRFDDYFPPSKPLHRAAARSIAPWLRRWDVRTATGVSSFVANSRFVRSRIREYYHRDAAIVHPFVHQSFLDAALDEARDDYHLVVSALVPYKKVELAMDAAVAGGKRLVILGGGPLLEKLRGRFAPNVELAGYVSRDRIIERLSRARSLILPGIEDFGITPLEAMALGTPVVALGAGGALDSIIPGLTGIFFERPTVDSLRQALDEVEAASWNRAAIRAHAATFSREAFDRGLLDALQEMTDRR